MKTFKELREASVKRMGTVSLDEGAENYTVKKGPYTRKVDGKTADKMKRQGWKIVAREGVELEEALKTTHVVVDTADGNKVISTAAGDNAEKNMRMSIASAERPPLNIKDKKTLKVVKLKRPISQKKSDDLRGQPLKEGVELEEGKMKEFHDYIDQGKSAQWIAKKMGLDMKTVKELMADMKESMDNLQSESLDLLHENLRTLARKGMGTETKKDARVGLELDFYETERGDKVFGKIIKVTGTGYTVQAMERGNNKKYTFKFYDRTKSKKLLESVEEGKTGAARLTNRLKKSGVDLDKRAKDRAASHAELKKKYAKESVELDEAYQQFLDKTPNWGEDKAISYGRKKGYKEIGVCGHGKIDGIVLFGMDAGDKAYVGKEAKVKTGQTVFRYATKRTVAGDIFPLVKIDVKRGILYNLSQKSSEGEIEHAEFETKGVKLRYLRLLASANLRDIVGFDPGFGSMKESTAPKTLSDIRETK